MGEQWKRLVPRRNRSGYLEVTLYAGGRRKGFRVNRLVLVAFVGPCPPEMEACHFPDRDPANNRLVNLRWYTPAGNAADRCQHNTDPQGERNPKHKLTDADVLSMREERRREGTTFAELGDRYGVTKSVAHKAVTGKLWRHLNAG